MEESERSLTMLHLRKTFSEYCRGVAIGQEDADKKLDRVLPLFGKVILQTQILKHGIAVSSTSIF